MTTYRDACGTHLGMRCAQPCGPTPNTMRGLWRWLSAPTAIRVLTCTFAVAGTHDKRPKA